MKAHNSSAFRRNFFWYIKSCIKSLLFLLLLFFAERGFADGVGISRPQDISRTFFWVPHYVPNGKEEKLVVTITVVTKDKLRAAEKEFFLKNELEKRWHRPTHGEKLSAWGSCVVAVQPFFYELSCYADLSLAIRLNAKMIKARHEDIVAEIVNFSEDVFAARSFENQI